LPCAVCGVGIGAVGEEYPCPSDTAITYPSCEMQPGLPFVAGEEMSIAGHVGVV
jgi:hypothetical protein